MLIQKYTVLILGKILTFISLRLTYQCIRGLELIYGFEPFSGPMHLGPKTGPLYHAFYT